MPGDRHWAIDIKRACAPKRSRGFYQTCVDIKPDRRFVVYNGTERLRLNGDTEAVSLSALAAEVTSLEDSTIASAGNRLNEERPEA